jgi:DNA-cytosine methyltransferase
MIQDVQKNGLSSALPQNTRTPEWAFIQANTHRGPSILSDPGRQCASPDIMTEEGSLLNSSSPGSESGWLSPLFEDELEGYLNSNPPAVEREVLPPLFKDEIGGDFNPDPPDVEPEVSSPTFGSEDGSPCRNYVLTKEEQLERKRQLAMDSPTSPDIRSRFSPRLGFKFFFDKTTSGYSRRFPSPEVLEIDSMEQIQSDQTIVGCSPQTPIVLSDNDNGDTDRFPNSKSVPVKSRQLLARKLFVQNNTESIVPPPSRKRLHSLDSASTIEADNDVGSSETEHRKSTNNVDSSPEIVSSDDEIIVTSVNKRQKTSALSLGPKDLSANHLSDGPQTTVTRWIGCLAGGLFLRTLLVCGEEDALNTNTLDDSDGNIQDLINITCDPKIDRCATWKGRTQIKDIHFVGSPTWTDKKSERIGYNAVIIDHITYKVSDCIAIRPQEGSTTGGLFARIVSLFDGNDGHSYAHVRWFDHGGETILGETAGPYELFLIDHCHDIPLGSVAQKIEVEYLGGTKSKSSGVGEVESNRPHKENHFFYRSWYSHQSEYFEAAELHEKPPLKKLNKNQLPICESCQVQALDSRHKQTIVVGKVSATGSLPAFERLGIRYHVHDFIYLAPNGSYNWKNPQPHRIAQISAIKLVDVDNSMNCGADKTRIIKLSVSARLLERFDQFNEDWYDEAKRMTTFGVRDNRHLFFTPERIQILDEQVIGKCSVRHVEHIKDLANYKSFEDTFYISKQISNKYQNIGSSPYKKFQLIDLQAHEIEIAEDSEVELASEMSRIENFLKNGKKLRGMDVFAGAGGLTVGLDMSQSVKTEWAIEINASASDTFARNFPSVKVYNADASILLKHVIEEHAGNNPAFLRNDRGHRLPKMPQPGEVEFIYGGCPCQDFSRCNRYPKSDSLKNSLPATFLSYVDHYRPQYFLLENVQALLSHRLRSYQVNKHKTEGGIEQGSLKFILRSLTSLGYQAQYKVLQAGNYGTPQSRQRVFIWGSRPNCPLPKYPEPSYVFPGRGSKEFAPHHAITVGDAITDLPSFDWRSKTAIKESRANKKERKDRVWGLDQVDIEPGKKYLGRHEMRHHRPPNSEFQQQMRQFTKDNKIFNHVTQAWGANTMERILLIPMRPGANHLDLPRDKDLWCLRDPGSKASSHGFYPKRYCRLSFYDEFQTCLTDINPSGDNGCVSNVKPRESTMILMVV